MIVSKAPLKRRGFTLIELIVTLLILAILASAAIPVTQLAFKRHKEDELRRALYTIRDALDAYKRARDEGQVVADPLASGYPPTLRVLVEGVTDALSPTGRKIYFLRRVPTDPFQPDDGEIGENSWAKRSYQSEPDDPRAGDDVFDVYSRSSGVGLNGVPYREW